MIEILRFLTRFCALIFGRNRFKIVDSRSGPDPETEGSMLLESEDMQLFLVFEKGQLIMDMRSVYDTKKRNWFSINLIGALLGHPMGTGLMDDYNTRFFESNFDEIMKRFTKANATATVTELNTLLARRLKSF